MRIFVGNDRLRIVDQVLGEWEQCKRDKVSRLVVLQGHPGVGKTRIVQEFYGKLAANQPSPPPSRWRRQRPQPFWPERLEPESDATLAGRHYIVPTVKIKKGPE